MRMSTKLTHLRNEMSLLLRANAIANVLARLQVDQRCPKKEADNWEDANITTGYYHAFGKNQNGKLYAAGYGQGSSGILRLD